MYYGEFENSQFRLGLTEQQIRIKIEFSLLLIKQFPSLVISNCTKKLLKLLSIYRGQKWTITILFREQRLLRKNEEKMITLTKP